MRGEKEHMRPADRAAEHLEVVDREA